MSDTSTKSLECLADLARQRLLRPTPSPAHHLAMFCVSETEATAIRDAFHKDGEFSAAVEFRRLFPGITDTAKARYWARVIAGWKPLPTVAPS